MPARCFVYPMGCGVLICFAVSEFPLCHVVVRSVADPFLLASFPPPAPTGLTRRRLHLTLCFRFFGSPCLFPFGREYLFVVTLLGCFGRTMAGRMVYMAGNLGIVLFPFRLWIGLCPFVGLRCCPLFQYVMCLLALRLRLCLLYQEYLGWSLCFPRRSILLLYPW